MESEGYLVDLDGTLLSGSMLLPGARWLVEKLGKSLIVVSNDAEHTPDELSRKLFALGLKIDAHALVLAGAVAIDEIARTLPGARIMMLTSASLSRYAHRKGLRPSVSNCDLVLVGRDRRFSYARLARAARAVADGVPLVVACPDTSHRGPDGEPVPEAGALAAAIEAAAGIRASRFVGKPEPTLFEIACNRLGLTPDRVTMIGDNPATDGLGARAMGMRFIRVAPGDIGPGLFAGESVEEA